MARLPNLVDGKLPKYAWPGGYPMFYLDGEDSVLCPDCANKYHDDIDYVLRPRTCDINWEDDSLYCDQCQERIESAYGED